MDAVKVIKKKGSPGAIPAITAYVDEPSLPEVTSEDAGKVLGVNESGEYELETIPVPESKKYYRHNIRFNSALNGALYFAIITSSAEPLNSAAKLNDYLIAQGYTSLASRFLSVCTISTKPVYPGATSREILFLTGISQGTSSGIKIRVEKVKFDMNESNLIVPTITESSYTLDSNYSYTDEVEEM